jgi:hypothetical protein
VATASQAALSHLCRFVELPYWGALGQLLKSKNAEKDAWELGRELVDTAEETNLPTHPVHLLAAARAGVAFLRSMGDATQAQQADEIKPAVQQLFARALAGCDRPEFAASRRENELAVASNWATFLMKTCPARAQEIRQLNDRVWRLLDDGAAGIMVWGEWFELLADREADHGEAAGIYGLGARHVPAWHQFWVKGAGAELLGRLTQCPVTEALKGKTPTELGQILKKAASGVKHALRGTGPSVVRDRWREGVRFFKRNWGNHPDVRPFLWAYRELERRG